MARALVDSRETDPMRVALRGELALQNAAFLKIERGEGTDIFDRAVARYKAYNGFDA